MTDTNPYPGLRPFEAEDAHLFFGREALTEELLRRLGMNRFLAVVGASGSGKSSLVRAGLLPALHGGFMAQAGSSWRIAIFRPGNDPIRALAQELNEVFGSDDKQREAYQAALIEATLRRGAMSLVEVVQQEQRPKDENLLVIADQFEELFRFKDKEQGESMPASEEAAAFVKLLLEAARAEAVPIYVVLTMRSDYLGDCAQFQGLPEAINDGQFLIPRMTRAQHKMAIKGPVAVNGATMEPNLIQRLLNDVGDRPDQLPILQHALMRTWDFWLHKHRDRKPLDLHHYEASGGMRRALSQHSDEIYDGLDKRSRAIAETLFKRLTDKDPEGRGIRHPTRLDELCAVCKQTGENSAEVTEKVKGVIEAFRAPGCSLLMPPVGTPLLDETMIDISHESLMRVWEKLSKDSEGWLDEEAESARIYQRLAEDAVQFPDQTSLWRPPRLQAVLDWKKKTRPSEAWAKRYDPDPQTPRYKCAIFFLWTSRNAEISRIKKKQDDKKEKRKQEDALIAAEAREEEQRKRFRVAAVLGTLAVGLALLAILFWFNADTQRGFAEQAREAAVGARDSTVRALVEAKTARDSTAQALFETQEARDSTAQALAVAERDRNRAQSAEQTANENAEVAQRERDRAQSAEQTARDSAVVAQNERDNARLQTRIADSRLLAAQSRVNNRLDLALLLSLAALSQG